MKRQDQVDRCQCPLAEQLLALHDEFSDFVDQSAFLCDAFAAIPARFERVDARTLAGMMHYADEMKRQVAAFRGDIAGIHDSACGSSKAFESGAKIIDGDD